MAVITGTNLANDLSGTSGADSISGLGGDDTLRGGLGDTLIGGAGDDTYYWAYEALHISVKNKYIKEDANQGHDTVITVSSGLDYLRLPDNVEDIYVTGSYGQLQGNDLDNLIDARGSVGEASIWGYGGDDIIYGTDNVDGIYGGTGIDGMLGGKGNDYYQVDNRDDIIIEFSGEGRDSVSSLASVYKLGNNVEELFLDGDFVQRGNGNFQNNLISSTKDQTRFINAGEGNDTVDLSGVADDLVIGGAGNDTLSAGLGGDVYRFTTSFGRDEVTDVGGDDVVDIDVAHDRLWFTRQGSDLKVAVIGTDNSVTVKNWYSDPAGKIEDFTSIDGKDLSWTKVDQLVSAMSQFAQPTTTTMPPNVQAALAPTLAATWQ